MADLQIAVEVIGKDSLSGSIGTAQKGIGGVVDGLGKLGLAGMAVTSAFGTITSGVSAFVGPAMEAQAVSAKLNAVLASTKGVAGMTAESIGGLSTSLSRVTTFEDDAITSAQSLLLTFTNVGKDVFPAATETILNMSQAMGQDLQASTVQLGKALNDPIAGIGALSRVGVQLTDSQEAMIKKMVAVGDTAGAQKVILGELETQFGGAARAAGETLGGQLAIAQNQFGELIETIGTALLPVLAKLLSSLMPVIQAFADKLPAALEAVQPLFDWLTEHMDQLVIPALVAFGAAATAAGIALVVAMGPVILTVGAVGVAIAALTALWTTNWGDIQGKVEAVWGVLSPIFGFLGAAFDLFTTTILPTMLASWTATWNSISLTFSTVWGAIQATIQAVWPLVEGIFLAGTALVEGRWADAWNGILEVFQGTWLLIKETLGAAITGLLNALGQLATDAGNAARSVGEAIVNAIKDAITDLGPLIKDALAGAVNAALDWAKSQIANWKPPTISIPLPGGGKIGGIGAGAEVIGGDLAAAPGSANAIGWAMSRIGQGGWAGWCERFVENAFGTGGRHASAWAAAQAMMTNPGGAMANAPAGTLLFFRPDASNQGFGHVGISLGDGRMVSATNNGPEVTGSSNYWQGLFAGWGPPRFAAGVRNFGGGLAVVGERGWELAQLPRGTNVYSHGQSERMLGGGTHYHFQFTGPVYGFNEFEDRVVEANERAQRRGRA